MVSSYTTNKSFEKPANGDYPNTWDVPVNADLDLIDKALGGQTPINVTGVTATPVTLTSSQYQPLIIKFSGVLTANVTYQVPSGVGGYWILQNTATGSFTITLSSLGAGRSLVVIAGVSVATSDGTNVDAPVNLPVPLYTNAGNFGVGTSAPNAFMEVRKDQNAATDVYFSNFNTGANAQARTVYSTGTANSSYVLGLDDNGGSPYFVLQAGTSVGVTYYQCQTHLFRSQSGTEIARFETSTLSLKFAADGLALTGTATAANFLANTASKILTTDKVWSSAVPVVITYAATTTLDFNSFINGKITLTGNLTIDTSNVTKAGQSGWIDFIQDATGSRTLSYTAGKFSSTGTLPSIASAASARTRLFYCIDENGRVFMSGSSSALVNN